MATKIRGLSMEWGAFGYELFVHPWVKVYADWYLCLVEGDDPMRRFIRHPSDIPIEFSLDESVAHSERLRDVSMGGLCFHSEAPVRVGAKIYIEIDLAPFRAEGTVAWCRKDRDTYVVGVEFSDHLTQFSLRMVEQICHIEHYRSEIQKSEGRALSSEEAAKEWIDKYAAEFPMHMYE